MEGIRLITYWCGRPIDELSRDELLEAIGVLAADLRYWQETAADYRKHLDVLAYLRDPALAPVIRLARTSAGTPILPADDPPLGSIYG